MYGTLRYADKKQISGYSINVAVSFSSKNRQTLPVLIIRIHALPLTTSPISYSHVVFH